MQKQRIKTSELLNRLIKTTSIDRFIERYSENMDETPFHEHITRLCTDRDEIPAHIIEKSGIERTFGHQIFNGRKNPSRDKVIQLAFGFEMDYKETQELLRAARKSILYPKIKRDVVIIYALENKLSVIDVQATLSELSLPLIGEENQREKS